MDFLNKSFQQVSDVFKSMSPGARITAGLLLGVIVISLVYLIQFTTIGSDQYLLSGREFSKGELAEMEAAFGTASLGDYSIEGYRIKVPRGKKQEYMGALADVGALPDGFNQIDKGVFGGSGFIPESKAVMEKRYKQAQEQNLSLIIREMKGIEYARVNYETEQKGGLRSSRETRAVAAVRADGNRELTNEQVNAIRNTVVGSIAGLKADNVTITDWNSGKAYKWSGEGNIAGVPHSEYIAHKQHHEKIYREKILERLKNYPGVVVQVDVELDSVLRVEEASTQFDKTPVPVHVRENTKSTTSSGESTGGVPGVRSNGGNANAPATVATTAGAGSTSEESSSEQNSLPGTTIRKTTKPGLVPKRVTTSIGVPRSYYVKLWHERNKPAAGEEPKEPDPAELQRMETETKDKIQKAVVTLIPKRVQGEDPWDHIIVQTDEDLQPAEIQAPGLAENAAGWLAGNWQSIGMLVFGVFSLLMLRGMVRSATDSPTPTDTAAPQLSVASDSLDSPLDVDTDEDERRLRFETGGPNLREELARLVKEDPDSAANVLKNWIGEAA